VGRPALHSQRSAGILSERRPKPIGIAYELVLPWANAESVTAAILTASAQKSAQESQAQADSQSNAHGLPRIVFDVVRGVIQTIFGGFVPTPDHALRLSLANLDKVLSQHLSFNCFRGQMREFEPGALTILDCCSFHILLSS
jgi:hypothetical protein